MDQKFAFRHLTKRVALDKDTVSSPAHCERFETRSLSTVRISLQVTYRLLSRELGITVKDAKRWACLAQLQRQREALTSRVRGLLASQLPRSLPVGSASD